MARELRRLLIDPARLKQTAAGSGRLELQRQEDHYLSRVLRLRHGDALSVIDGRGGLWQAQRGEGAWLEALQPLAEPQLPPSPGLCLALALPRQDIELVWRMATELGVDRLQPLHAERCQASSRHPSLERWSAVLREATEQCERLWLPALEPCREASAWFERPSGELRLLATTRRQELPAIEQVLSEQPDQGKALSGITLVIGPEGGWSPGEEQRAEATGCRPVSLGGTILRTSTAAVAGLSRLAAWRSLSC